MFTHHTFVALKPVKEMHHRMPGRFASIQEAMQLGTSIHLALFLRIALYKQKSLTLLVGLEVYHVVQIAVRQLLTSNLFVNAEVGENV